MAVQLATNSSERLKVVDLTYVLSLADLQASIQRLMALCMTSRWTLLGVNCHVLCSIIAV